ncbi:MAG: hypothetical protein VKJ24_05770 [Synechococcales bacterium]|nr:hypothetical protein [Synechococcales bacterium]
MSALHKLPQSPPQRTRNRPVGVRRTQPQQRHQQNKQYHRTLALETSIKLATNLIISSIAVGTLIHLLPYRSAQQAKLVELQQEVQQVEHRVSSAKDAFGQAFNSDPKQVKEVLKQQTAMTDPSERQIVFDDRLSTANEKAAQLPE